MGQYNHELEKRAIAAAQKRITGLRAPEDYESVINDIESRARELCDPDVYSNITALPVTRAMLGDGRMPTVDCIEELRNAYQRIGRIRYHKTGTMPSL